jgi:hypothetical protein
MNFAKNMQMLAEGGYVSQTIRECESESISVLSDNEANEYLFSDGSCIRIENRTVTEVETFDASPALLKGLP